MDRNVKLTVLADNNAKEPLTAEWGLSVYITAGEKKILLDTGSGPVFSENAEKLGIDLAAVDFGVLSHAHHDHADGLDTFFRLNRAAPFFVREGVSECCYGVKEGVLRYNGIRRGILDEFKDRIRYVSGVCELEDGIFLIPHRKEDYSPIALRNSLYVDCGGTLVPDGFVHEQTLAIDTDRGLAVFNSCSHTGMVNILADIREALGRSDVFAYVGGLHLYRMTDEEIGAFACEIGNTGVRHIFTGHCTGDHAFTLLKEELGDRITQFSAGSSFRL